MKQHIQALLVTVALTATLFTSSPGLAAEQAQWLSVGKENAPSAIRADAVRPTDTGVDVVVTLPGALSSPMVAKDGNAYTQLSIPGCGLTAERAGSPALPFKGFFVEVPYGVQVSVVLGQLKTVSLGVGHKILPLQPPEPDDEEEAPPFQIDAAAYANDSFCPTDPVSVGEPGFIRGRRVVFVKVFPLQYNPATTELRAHSSLHFRLRFDGQIDGAGQVRKARLATDASEALARQFVLNYTAPEAPAEREEEPFLAEGEGADYLIIVADALYDEILPLAEWKHRKGLATRILRSSEVGTTAADVKAAIKNAYDTWDPAPSYVLLVGDFQDIPPDYLYGELECYTDHPYSCVDGLDYYPDLALGRLSVHTPTECAQVVAKTLTYERTPDPGNWYHSFLSAGFFQDDNNDGEADRWFMETSAYVAEFLETTIGMTKLTAWCTNSFGHDEYHYRSRTYPHRFDYPDPVPESVTSLWLSSYDASAQITSAFNSGVGFVMHRDHGSETGWSDPPFYVMHVYALTNGVMTPVVLSINCKTGSFHRSSGDCLCEALLKSSQGGAVAVVGSTRNSYSGYNDLIAHGMMTSLWPSYDPSHTDATYPQSTRPAEALMYGKYYMLTYKGTGTYTEAEFKMFHWFGDPDLDLRTQAPQALTVTHPNAVGFALPVDVPVTVELGGTPLEGAMVAISHAGTREYWSEPTGPDGAVTFSGITFSQRDDYDLVVTGHDAIPYESIITAATSSAGTIHLDREAYCCACTIGIQATDSDLEGTGLQTATVTTSGGDTETVALTETEPDNGIFYGTISTGDAPATANDGVVQIADGETITATYEDEDNGTTGPATVQDTATADCVPPTISNVQITEVAYRYVVVTYETDVPTTARARCGPDCGGPYPFAEEDPVLSTTHTLKVTGLSEETPYHLVVDAWDAAGNLATDDNDGACYSFTTPYHPDYFTEWFESGDNDLAYHTVTFTPSGMGSFYSACCDPATEFPTDPNGGSTVNLTDNSWTLILLEDGKEVSLYGTSSFVFVLGSNGYITGYAFDSNPAESFDAHFSEARISMLFDDLDPEAGGTVTYRQTEDRFAVTFENVPESGTTNSNSFQCELFYDGRIRLTWLGIDATDGLVGLSQGGDTPADFSESDLSAYGTCQPQYQLTVALSDEESGHVVLDPEPDDPNELLYPEGTEVTLTAVLDDPKQVFSYWLIYDPGHPGDVNYAVKDWNNPITLTMDANREVLAKYQCGSVGDGNIIIGVGMTLVLVMIRRRR